MPIKGAGARVVSVGKLKKRLGLGADTPDAEVLSAALAAKAQITRMVPVVGVGAPPIAVLDAALAALTFHLYEGYQAGAGQTINPMQSSGALAMLGPWKIRRAAVAGEQSSGPAPEPSNSQSLEWGQ